MATAVPSLPFTVPGGESAPQWRVIAPLVLARDGRGLLHYAYHGALLPWLSPEQEAWFLELGLVERVVLNPVAEPAPNLEPEPTDLDAETTEKDSTDDEFIVDPEADSETTLQASRIQDCVDVIDELGISRGAGAPTIREKLRSAGHVFSNDIIAAAIRARKLPKATEE